MLYEKQNMQRSHYSNALKLFKVLHLRVKSNAKYLAHFLVELKKGFKRDMNTNYDIIRKIVSLKLQANPLINL